MSAIVLRWPGDGTPIALYEKCRCGSGRVFRECCLAFVVEPLTADEHRIRTYVMCADLWPQDRVSLDDVLSTIARFDPRDLTQTLARINVRMQDDYFNPRSTLELAVLRLFFPPDWHWKLEQWILSGKRAKAFHKLLFPSILLKTLAGANAAQSAITVKGNETTIGPLALRFNQVLEDDYQQLKDQADSESGKKRVLYASIYRQAFYSHVEAYPDSLGRIWHLVTKGIPAGAAKGRSADFDFEAEFTSTFFFGFRDMLAYGFAVLAHYSLENRDLFIEPAHFILNRTSFKNVVSSDRRVESERIFDYLGLPWDKHIAEASRAVARASPQNLYQLYSLYDHPLIEMPDGAIFPLDAQFLRACVTEGAYWALFNALIRQGRERELRDAFGHATEWYAGQLLRESCRTAGDGKLWLDWDGEIRGSGTQKPDGVLREEGTLYFIEVTTSSVSPGQASSGDPDVLAAAFKKLWFGESPKLVQLANAMAAFERGDLTLHGVDRAEITHIRPVFVVLRDFPQWPVLMDWYRELMREGGMTERFIEDILLIDIEELEELANRLLHGDTWTSILGQKRLSSHPDMSMHNFLCLTDRARERHPLLERAVTEAGNAILGPFQNAAPQPSDDA
jgi:hypothetical protein